MLTFQQPVMIIIIMIFVSQQLNYTYLPWIVLVMKPLWRANPPEGATQRTATTLRTLRLLFLSSVWVLEHPTLNFFFKHGKYCETGPTVCSPYPRRLESLTICRWNCIWFELWTYCTFVWPLPTFSTMVNTTSNYTKDQVTGPSNLQLMIRSLLNPNPNPNPNKIDEFHEHLEKTEC